MGFIPYAKHNLDQSDIDAVIATMKSDWVTSGPKVPEFEEKLREGCGAKHVIALHSCTAALHISMLAAGIGPGDEVITTPMTFAATSNAVLYCGATPVFVDIERETRNINPSKIEEKITPRTRAIVPVHFGGHPCRMREVYDIAEKHGLKVIEDAAHAYGAEYLEPETDKWHKIGDSHDKTSFATCFSFHPVKNFTSGEGGAIATNDDEFAIKCQFLRNHGISRDAWKRFGTGSWFYEMVCLGYKYNMMDMQAALGISQLSRFPKMQQRRRDIIKKYREGLKGIDNVSLPFEKPYAKSSWHLYVITLNYSNAGWDCGDITPNIAGRNLAIEHLKSAGIGSIVHYIPVYRHPYYAEKFGIRPADFPITEEYYSSCITLPLHAGLTDQEADFVIGEVASLFGRK